MANFPTHIGVGTVVSGALATVTLATDVVTPRDLVAVTLAGVLGSVLPDIDLKDSRPSRAMFAGLAIFFGFAVLFSVESRYSVAEMLILWLGTLFLVRFVAGNVFYRFSYHRGMEARVPDIGDIAREQPPSLPPVAGVVVLDLALRKAPS